MTTQEQIAEWYHEHGCELSADSLAARIEAALGAAVVKRYNVSEGYGSVLSSIAAGVEALKGVQTNDDSR